MLGDDRRLPDIGMACHIRRWCRNYCKCNAGHAAFDFGSQECQRANKGAARTISDRLAMAVSLSNLPTCVGFSSYSRIIIHAVATDVFTYIWLLVSNWASWATGGIATAVFYAWERYRGKQYGWGTIAVFISFAFVAGSYQTWHDEYTQNSSRSVTREKHVAQLQKFYSEIGALIDEPLPKDISEADFNKYVARVQEWDNNAAEWIELNMGSPARRLFFGSFRNGRRTLFKDWINEVHNTILIDLTRQRGRSQTADRESDLGQRSIGRLMAVRFTLQLFAFTNSPPEAGSLPLRQLLVRSCGYRGVFQRAARSVPHFVPQTKLAPIGRPPKTRSRI